MKHHQKILDDAVKGEAILLLTTNTNSTDLNSTARSLNFLAINGTIRRIPDDADDMTLKSIASVRVVQKWLHVENSTLSMFKIGSDVPHLPTRNPDETIMSYLTLQRVFQADIIDDIILLDTSDTKVNVNPCVTKWRGKYNIMSTAGFDAHLQFYLLDDKYKVTEKLTIVGEEKMPKVEDTRLWFMEDNTDVLYAIFTVAAMLPYEVGIAVFNISLNQSDPVNSTKVAPYLNLSMVARVMPPVGKEEHES